MYGDADYIVDDFSDYEDDQDDSSSSEDEVQAFIKRECGIIEIKDDFEDEMDKAITAHMKKLDAEQSEDKNKPTTSQSSNIAVTSSTTAKTNEKAEEEKRNDELFYDPHMDEADQKWIDDKRRAYIFPATASSSSSETKPLPNSDAVLNCPACLSLLCLDCQRHSIYNTQYRAMFVTNCNVITGETLAYPSKSKKKKKVTDENKLTDSVYNPVRCTVCNTEVAVYDSDEVYHFFNVLASYA